ncbi:hypothetical protein PCANC_01557 [Puccinia coronata f. sp. avenae]|uniref:Uncharacterized protein n=1 Tax=Puccinia coronata f. sp. avenae TaxID=200324 RepID=A0A2N5W0T4_9BASI|nr:hypothetical protein PCASD_14898 [Puccinia coronata f. sp. avenae]PLW55792.1 hypothetical protein PCANC_01557 [Puccinia coronata f. sp. avenae]
MHKSTTRLSSHRTEDQSMPLLDTVKSETAREWCIPPCYRSQYKLLSAALEVRLPGCSSILSRLTCASSCHSIPTQSGYSESQAI